METQYCDHSHYGHKCCFHCHPSHYLQTAFLISIREEYDEVENLNAKANAIGCGNENTLWMDKWKAVKHPQHAIHCCGQVWVWFVLLHRLFFEYLNERWHWRGKKEARDHISNDANNVPRDQQRVLHT
uniref:Uncharacterized protein n=1 Tax=Opuntia streptacantha TaxID=393608 RepID=A0A7C8YJI7_OPUST